MMYRYLLTLLLALCSMGCYAQYTYQQLDNSYGLSNSCINSIHQDSDNLIWFGTWDGLNFYDGGNVHVFNYERTELKHNSIASNVIYQLTEDKKRNIWIGTVEGLSRFDKNTGDFSNYFYSPKMAVSNGYTVAVNNKGQVYAARRNSSELYVYDAAKDIFTRCPIQKLGHFMLIKIFFDDQDNLWLLKDNGILEAFTVGPAGFTKRDNFTAVDQVDDVFYCNHQLFYTTKSNGLFRIWDGYYKQKLVTLPHELRAMSFFDNRYVLAWSSKGIGEYDADFKPAQSLSSSIPLLQNMRVTSLISDKNNLLWLGTDGNGVIKVTPKDNSFGLEQKQANGQAFHIPVRAFCQVGSELWIGTKGNGIITLKNWDKNEVSYSDIKSFHTTVDVLDNCVYSIKKGADGLVYIGSDAPGVTLYNLKSKKFIKWGDIPGTGRYPAFGSVHCILQDKDSSVWMGLNESGLIHLKLLIDKDDHISIKYLEQYQYNGGSDGPANNVIYSLASGTDNRLWVGCRYGGLSLFDKKSRKFSTLKAFSYEGSLSNNDVLSLHLDHQNRLWVGTSFGLNWVDEKVAGRSTRPAFKKLYVDDGLPNNTIHAIEEDNSGNIWISSNKGLAKINPSNLKIVQYKESDGLQSDEFSDNAVWKNPDGMLFFGGIYGFNYFLPQNIHVNNEQPRLLISDLHFAGKNTAEKGLYVLTKEGPATARNFETPPGDGYFELTVQPVTYAHAQKCQYAYFLQGNDKSWHYMGNHDKIIYNNLGAGTYSLKIKWSNGEGAWTDGVTAFTVRVEQYFWLTPLAFLLYALVFIAAGYGYLRYRKNKFMLAHELKMEHMLREKDEKQHQEQLNFFTNIAHELQTPLTLILGSLERYLFKNKQAGKQQGGHFLAIVKQEASRLHYLVQQLMEFRKAEAGHLENHFSKVNASELLTNIAGLFTPLVDEKNLDFSWHIEPGINLYTDRDKLEKIIFNMLSNAFKHAGEKQYVIFSANQLTDKDSLELIVANSGCKLTDGEIDRLFDRFFVVDGRQNNKNSTGIGLAFTQQMVNLMEGQITAECVDSWISFKVLLPLNTGKGIDPLHPAKPETASYLVNAITTGQEGIALLPIVDNNKKSLIKSFEQEERKTILIVEDDPLIRYLLKDILTEIYIVYEASTGLEALEVMKRSAPDIILSDIMMPDMDGLELCKLVKNTTETCHIPFVLLSARTAIEHKTEGYGCGADAYIPKPFETEHLLVRIQKLLEYREKMHRVFNMTNKGLAAVTANDLNESDKHFIEKVTRIIEDNLDEALDSAFLERQLNLSKIQVYRRVKTLADMTPTELIRHIRLQKASALLLSSDLTVSEIFYRTGFNNKTYFFREFKRIFNCSPNDYRATHRLPDLNTREYTRIKTNNTN